MDQFRLSKTQFDISQPNNTGASRLYHLDFRPLSQSHFFQSLHDLVGTRQVINTSSLAGLQKLKWNRRRHDNCFAPLEH